MLKQTLCVTVTGSTMADLRRRRDAVTAADLVELRLDTVPDPDVAAALADRRRPVIVTCRPTWEGGSFTGSEEERQRILETALAAGAEYVDVEFRAGFADVIARTGGKRVVISSHDFDELPTDLPARVRAMRATGAEIVKVAVKTAKLADCVALHDLATRMGPPGGLLVIGMGEHGLITRVIPSRFHAPWTYAGALSGIGQLTPDALVREFRFHEITAHTPIYGVVGSPVSHSVSPAMHNAAFRALGLDGVYLPLPAVDVHDFITFARAFDLRGASVTTPYKVGLFSHVDAASQLATQIGAINTIRVDGTRWLGDNSDVHGFLEPLDSLGVAATQASILGAGGAARGVAIALASRGAAITVHARSRERAAAVARLVSGEIGSWPPARGSWDLLVNCTSVGMYPSVDESPIPAEHLGGGLVYDLVYNPTETKLIRDARRAGCRTIGGLSMLVGQGRQQFEWWTGARPPADVMWNAAANKLEQFTPPLTMS